MDDIAYILSKKDFDVPPEVRAIKEYVRRNYKQEVHVTMQPRIVLISARSAALIGTLRLNTTALQKAAQTDKRLVFRTA